MRSTIWWTRYFISASALGMVLLSIGHLRGMSTTVHALVGLLLVVLPMIFGMGYLLLPSFAGTTLATPRLPDVHLLLAYLGGGLVVGETALAGGGMVRSVGAALWISGVVLFLGSLLYTMLPAAREDPLVLVRGTSTPKRSTMAATTALPVGLAYLLVGSLALVVAAVPTATSGIRLQMVVHL